MLINLPFRRIDALEISLQSDNPNSYPLYTLSLTPLYILSIKSTTISALDSVSFDIVESITFFQVEKLKKSSDNVNHFKFLASLAKWIRTIIPRSTCWYYIKRNEWAFLHFAPSFFLLDDRISLKSPSLKIPLYSWSVRPGWRFRSSWLVFLGAIIL